MITCVPGVTVKLLLADVKGDGVVFTTDEPCAEKEAEADVIIGGVELDWVRIELIGAGTIGLGMRA